MNLVTHDEHGERPFTKSDAEFVRLEMARQSIRFHRRDHPEAAPSWELMETLGAKLFEIGYVSALNAVANVIHDAPPDADVRAGLIDLADEWSELADAYQELCHQ